MIRKDTTMASWQSGDVETNGIRLHYTRTGGAKPPLVLAHGVTDSGLCWTPIAEALAADYDVIMVDARPWALGRAGTGL
jgi:pimeloyl-ACP methyl ester carboxylesterase